MASIAKTVGSFDKVLASCTTIGATYQPNVPELSLTALGQLHERAQQSLKAVTEARIAYRMAVNNRKDSFEGIPALAVRVVRMMAVCSRGDHSHLEDAVQIKDKLYSPKKSQASDIRGSQMPVANIHASVEQSPSAEKPVQSARSSGRRSFDQQMETFSNLVELAEKVGTYNPVEAEMTVQGLKQTLADLRIKSQQVTIARAMYKKALLDRNILLFGSDGISEITKAVKNYIHGAFGIRSNESKQLAGRS